MAVNSSVRVANLNADKVDGRDAAAFLRYGEDIPSGETITGVFGGSEQDQSGAAVITTYRQTVSFPVPAPDDLTDTTVNFAPSGFAGDDDATCTGNDENPTAPPGQVCIYFSIIPSGTNIAADSAVGEAIPSNNSRRGFVVKFSGFGSAGLAGTWSYTAP